MSTHREIDKAEVDRIGQGQVWTGMDALDIGLIDEIGNLGEAIAAAAELADLDEGDYGQKIFEEELSPGEQLAVDFLGTAKWFGIDPSPFIGKPSVSMQRIVEIVNALSPLTKFNDPKGVYSHCFCDFE